MRRIETKAGHLNLDSWLRMSAMEEKLQNDRVALLNLGKPWKVKHSKQFAKDQACVTITQKLRNNEFTTKQYLERIMDIMGDY